VKLWAWIEKKWLKVPAYENIKAITYFKVVDYGNVKLLVNSKYWEPEKEFEAISKRLAKDLGNDEYTAYDLAINSLDELRQKNIILQNAITVLHINKDESIIKEVEGIGYKFNPENDESYYQSIEGLERQCKGLMTKIQFKIEEINRKYKKNEPKKKFDFYQTILSIRRTLHIEIDYLKISLFEYAQCMKAYNKEIETLNNG
jgi:hypothetical protein